VSSQLIKQALNSVGDLSNQYPETVKISTRPDILLRSQMDKLLRVDLAQDKFNLSISEVWKSLLSIQGNLKINAVFTNRRFTI